MTTQTAEAESNTVSAHSVKAWCTRNPGWDYADGTLRKTYSFGAEAEAAQFAAKSIRRASQNDQKVTVSLDGREVELMIKAAPGGLLTRDELQMARRYDLEPKGD